MKIFRTATVAALCAATTLTGVSLAPAAQAEGHNGGCYSYHNVHDDPLKYVSWKSCIKRQDPYVGWLRTSARIWLQAGHPRCQVEFSLLKAGSGSRVYKHAWRWCPRGRVKNRYIKGFDYHSNPSRNARYTVVVRIRGVPATTNAIPRSPYLQLP
ncbi:hypothetical protein ACFYYR_14205 [Streptomyces sp. NPDC001922]|uniref:hypothetical protein n=1 Tax=Streptomyces sp. NPDC001922 TaxID=3364624 RepID=UPI00368401A6